MKQTCEAWRHCHEEEDLRKKTSAAEKIPVLLTPADRDLIRDETFYDPDFAKMAECRGNKLVVPLPLNDIEDLQGFVAAAANHCPKRKLQARLDKLFEKLQRYLDGYEEE